MYATKDFVSKKQLQNHDIPIKLKKEPLGIQNRHFLIEFQLAFQFFNSSRIQFKSCVLFMIFQFDPVSTECADFFHLIPPNCPNSSNILKNYDKIIKEIEHQYNTIFAAKKSKAIEVPAIHTNLPTVKYCRYKLAKFIQKEQSVKRNLQEKAKTLSDEAISFLLQCKQSQLTVSFQMKEFAEYLAHNFLTSKEINKIDLQIQYLLSYIQRHNMYQSKQINENTLLTQLKNEIIKQSESPIYDGYYASYEFDERVYQLFSYKIHTLVNESICQFQTEHFFHFESINSYTLKILNDLNFKPYKSQYGSFLLNSITRNFFNVLYLKMPQFLFEPSLPSFFDHCNIVQMATPKQLSIPSKLIRQEDMTLTINLLAEQNIHLKMAVNSFYSMQFSSNPLDIVHAIHTCVKKCEAYLIDNSILKVYDSPKKSKKLNSDEMSFDDFFPLFYSVMAVNPAPNAVQIKDFFDMSTGINYPSEFEFSKVLYTSSVELLINLKSNIGIISYTPEEVDPLLGKWDLSLD